MNGARRTRGVLLSKKSKTTKGAQTLLMFTESQGLIHVLARGIGKLNSKTSMACAEAVPVDLELMGKEDFPFLARAESRLPATKVAALMSYLWFMLEMLSQLLPHHEAHPGVYAAYEATLSDMMTYPKKAEVFMGSFLLTLLMELGLLSVDALVPLSQDAAFHVHEGGFVPSHAAAPYSPLVQKALCVLAKKSHSELVGIHIPDQVLAGLRHWYLQVFEELTGKSSTSAMLLPPLRGL